MKVLWFANTPCGASIKLTPNLTSGGWLSSLDKLVSIDIDLHVAFYHNESMDAFKLDHTTYHPLFIKLTYMDKLKSLWRRNFIHPKNIDLMLAKINDVKPDLIHIHGSENDFIKLIDYTNVPTLLSIQGVVSVFLDYFDGGLDLSKILAVKNRNLVYQFFGIGYFEKLFLDLKSRKELEMQYLPKFKYFLGRTNWDFRVSKSFAPNSTYLQLNEALRDSFYSASYKSNYQLIDKDKIQLISICTNIPHKGFDVILRTSIILKSIGISFQWKICGLAYNDELVQLSLDKYKLTQVPEELNFLGINTEFDLQKNLVNSDIFIFTSYIENSPNSLGEAMLLGLPCIVSNCGGVPSMIDNESSGLLFQPGDYRGLIGHLLEVIKNLELREKIGLSARKSAMKFHNKDLIKNQIIQHYNFIVKNDYE